MKQILVFLLLLLLMFVCRAEYADTTARELKEVVVDAKLQRTSAEVSTYIPTAKMKAASLSATDLLNRMGIPQLRFTPGDEAAVQTASGQAVDIYIDYQPAATEDITGMRMADVKKVEYYDYPADPRFHGKAHVVNFIMQKYEYGGYVKAYGAEYFIANSGQLNLYSKIQYKSMTYDVGVGAYYNNNRHIYSNTSETYRIPQADGSIKEIERISTADGTDYRRRYYWPTFKVLYKSDNISISNTIGANFDDYPRDNSSGKVLYSPAMFAPSAYTNTRDHRNNSVTYNGYWNFNLPHGNTINFSPYYSYSRTRQNTVYTEGDNTLVNGANDNSHAMNASLRFVHSFGRGGTLTVLAQASYTSNRTSYSGTSTAYDHTRTYRIYPGVNYSISTKHVYAMGGIGLIYDKATADDRKESSTAPWADLSVQYSPNGRHSLAVEAHYFINNVTGSLRSTAVIQSNPLLSYTGNPGLKPYKSYSTNISYTWLPSNTFNMTAFGNAWSVGDRYAYLYSPDGHGGIIRTISQPCGSYTQGMYGLYASLRLLRNSLQIFGQVAQRAVHNGMPYNFNKVSTGFSIQAMYYLDNWNFGGYYALEGAYTDGCMVGTMVHTKSNYAVWAGWANSSVNVKCLIANPARLHWHESTSVMRSEWYDSHTDTYSPNSHCFIQLSATYTFGFGKKVEQNGEASQQTGTSSGILR